MSLEPGSRLGPYEVISPLGAGGMGEVYRARDGRLKRDVALKILPAFFAADPDRLARFEREAQALAALNHPNIAAIHGFEESDGVRALVLELVEGDTLAERIARGRVPVGEALTIARQIAAALEVAHEQGIVHRDLKPANVKITPNGVVKVLDFGLAKLTSPGDASDSAGRVLPSGPVGAAGSKNQDPAYGLSMSPTMTSPALVTGAGVLLGTAAYMAPEQARGKTADKRADIWAFGVVLYEMLTGTRAFGGDSVTETAGAVIHKELDWSAMPEDLPPIARTVLYRCLQKDPTQRARDMGDVRLALEGAFTPELQPPAAPAGVGSRRRIVELTAAALLAALATGAGFWMLTRTEPPARFPIRVDVTGPEGMGPFLALSPDGRSIAFIASDSGNMPTLRVHSLESAEIRELANAGVVRTPPFWSPDGRWLAFASDGKLKRIDVGGGPAETLCDVGNFLGGTWTRDNTILFADLTKRGIMQVAASGGTPVQRTQVDEKRGEAGHFFPWALPDGRHFLYLAGGNDPGMIGIYVGSVDASPTEQDRTRLIAARQGAAYMPATGAGPGYLLFLRDGLLMAQPFDEGRRTIGGEATAIAEQVGNFQIFGMFAASTNGTLAYLRAGPETRSLVSVGPNGQVAATIAADLKGALNPRLSPDGRSVAVVVSGDVWRYDLDGRPPIKLTFDGGHNSPLWTPDGQRVVYEVGGAKPQLAALPSDGSGGTPEPVSPVGHFHPHGWTTDGREIVAVRMGTDSTKVSTDIVRFPARSDGQVQPVLATPAEEGLGAWISPDGRWLAYTSDSTGRTEIWVRPFPGPGAAVRVSPGGGVEPVWARDGRQLFYLEDTNMMAVAVDAGAMFDFKPPIRLFESTYFRGQQPPSYDVAPDGRFVMTKPDDSTEVPITLILNWTERLRQRGATH